MAAATVTLREVWRGDALRRARRALARRDAEILADQIAVSEIPAPTGDEGERGAWVAARFRRSGLADVRTDGAGNVIGRRPGARDGAPVVICAHLDTVFPRDVPARVSRRRQRLSGPGIGDNGRGLAVMLALAGIIDGRALCTQAPVDFVATTGEEGLGDLRGAKALFAGPAAEARAAIALDGAGDERIVHRALGSRRFRVAFRGTGGHSWSAWGVPNPIHAAGTATARLSRLALPVEPRATLSVGRIGGGLSVNSIAAEAWMEIDVRCTSSATLDRLQGELHAIVAAAADEENARRAPAAAPLTARIAVIGDRPSGETPADHPLVAAAIAATRQIGRSPVLVAASTDANVPISLGIPAIAIGAGGRGGDAHTPGEWYENAEGHRGVVRALGIVVAVAR